MLMEKYSTQKVNSFVNTRPKITFDAHKVPTDSSEGTSVNTNRGTLW